MSGVYKSRVCVIHTSKSKVPLSALILENATAALQSASAPSRILADCQRFTESERRSVELGSHIQTARDILRVPTIIINHARLSCAVAFCGIRVFWIQNCIASKAKADEVLISATINSSLVRSASDVAGDISAVIF